MTRHVERFRETSPGFWLESLWQDVRYAFRAVTRNRVFFLASVLSVAVGIGGSTALFSVLHATVLNPFTYPESERLAVITSHKPGESQATAGPIVARDLHEYAALGDVFDGVGGSVPSMFLLNDADVPTRTANITCNFFDVAGVRAGLGRTPSDEDCVSSSPGVVLLSHELWTRRFGASSDVIGQTLRLRPFLGQKTRLDEQLLTIIGIMPPRVSLFEEEAWIPSKVDLQSNDYLLYVLARLRTDVPLGDAAMRVAIVSARLAARERQEIGSSRPSAPVGLQSLREHVVGDYQATIYALLTGAVCVLLIACMNVALLLSARTTAGRAEIGVRVCLGAGAVRIVRQIGIESLLISVGGGIVGVGLAAAVLPTLSAFVLIAGVASQADIKLNLAAVAVAAGLVVLAASLFGIGPALHALRLDPLRALVGRFGTTPPPHAGRWRGAIVATQVAMAFPVFCVALAVGESFMGLRAATAKYGPDFLLLVVPRGLELEAERYRSVDARARLWRELDAAIQAVPGVLSTASTAPLALNRAITATVAPIGGGDATRWESQLRCASPDFFSTMKIPVVRGRTFDGGAMARQRVAVVSRSFARAYFGDADPLGHHVRITKAPPICPASDDPLEIVGIVENTQLPDVQTGNPESPPTLYVSTDVATPRFAQFLVRTSVPAATLRRDVQRAVATVNPELVGRARSLEEDVDEALMPWPRLLVRAALSCSAAGLLLVLGGIFGLLSYLTAQLMREIGIRMALGASPADIGRHVLGRGMRWAVLGMAVGTVATFALQELARSRIWGFTALDVPLTGAIAALVMIATGVASWFPARRAMRIDPVAVIRSE